MLRTSRALLPQPLGRSPLNLRRSLHSENQIIPSPASSAASTTPDHPELVPPAPLLPLPTREGLGSAKEILGHLEWLHQKDQLRQDMFLLGPPGSYKRRLALTYCYLAGREVEMISASRDTGEADLKQRREIRTGRSAAGGERGGGEGGRVEYVDQCAVRAAIHGRMLVVEGVEKVERNVLPILNNLLENREMNLEDGRHLLHFERYDQLVREHSQKVVDRWRLVRTSEQFRVMALGVPVPPFPGATLDPPFRSRFQVRYINPFSYFGELESLRAQFGANSDKLDEYLTSLVATMHSNEMRNEAKLPYFSSEAISQILGLSRTFADEPKQKLIERFYPFKLEKSQADVFASLLTRFELAPKKDKVAVAVEAEVRPYELLSISPSGSGDTASVTFSNSPDKVEKTTFAVPSGPKPSGASRSGSFVNTPYHDKMLVEMLQAHSQGDFCLFGEKGTGKTALIHQFASLLDYQVETIQLYRDMTSRDILERRTTTSTGDTTWERSPLVNAALKGRLAVLDGIEHLAPGTLASLQSLIHDRQVSLPDGTRLLGSEAFRGLKASHNFSDAALNERGIFEIPSTFRVIATAGPVQAKPQAIGGQSAAPGQWLTEEVSTMFQFLELRLPTVQEEQAILTSLTKCPPEQVEQLLAFSHLLRNSGDSSLLTSSYLSMRQMLRICRRLAAFSEETLFVSIQKSFLFPFLPQVAKGTLLSLLRETSIRPSEAQATKSAAPKISDDGKTLNIGGVSATTFSPSDSAKALVPHGVFFDNTEHTRAMRDMMVDFMNGEHLLLIGNQGVGKNKLCDRFLQLMNRPREYIQLHRDTTVQNLMVQPTIKDGIIKFEDSPLVRACKEGHVLVIDEADKAPVHVTAVLKSLAESGELALSDGRMISRLARETRDSGNVIPLHPDFQMIVLANRPGFPFLGNDFYKAIGDVFSSHPIENPDPESEIELLKNYGPDVNSATLSRLVGVFGDLRKAFDEGVISYPYSLRELMSIVKHLQKYKEDSLSVALRNVFDFDVHNNDFKDLLINTLQAHGFPITSLSDHVRPPQLPVQLVSPTPLPDPLEGSRFEQSTLPAAPGQAPQEIRFGREGPFTVTTKNIDVRFSNSRISRFTEEVGRWILHLGRSVEVVDAISAPMTEGTSRFYILAREPLAVHSFEVKTATGIPTKHSVIDLSTIFRYNWTGVVTLGRDPKNQETLALFDEKTGVLVFVNPQDSSLEAIEIKKTLMPRKPQPGGSFFSRGDGPELTLCMAPEGTYDPETKSGHLAFYTPGASLLALFNGTKLLQFKFPHGEIQEVAMVDHCHWLIRATSGDVYKAVLDPVTNELSFPLVVHERQQEGSQSPYRRDEVTQISPGTYSLIPQTTAAFGHVIDFGRKDGSIASQLFVRPPEESQGTALKASLASRARPQYQSHFLSSTENRTGTLQVVDLKDRNFRNIEAYDGFKVGLPEATSVLLRELTGDITLGVIGDGTVISWQLDRRNLEKGAVEWRQFFGEEKKKVVLPQRKEFSTSRKKEIGAPKHGKEDDQPHVGGSTFAGGSGGSGTAGLGGRGGPYRLDKGHDVYQVSSEAKEEVPEHVLKAAREMAKEALRKRLDEIGMSEHDMEVYKRYYDRVAKQIKQLRVILEGVQAKSKERIWLKNQTSGELDDTKLIDGLTGETNIYKKRGIDGSDHSGNQELPKRFKIVMDVSGSMYRFNGVDSRLTKSLEVAVMVMEAFEGIDPKKFHYEICGHSGDSPYIPFVSSEKPPKDEKERLKLVHQMSAHTQYCMSGDYTLEGTEKAIKDIVQQPADDYFVLVISDANMERYGISASRLSNILQSDARVNSHILFIGSLGNEAEVLTKQLPRGKAFLCLDTGDLPKIVQQIFLASMQNTP